MRYLDQIESPEDLRKLSVRELPEVAREIRERLIRVVSSNGGHLASSLGAVDLTLALHYVFDTPRDAIVWDVGHQAYAHKLITGRNASFDTLRRLGGVAGFPRRGESPHDAFGGYRQQAPRRRPRRRTGFARRPREDRRRYRRRLAHRGALMTRG